MRTAALPGANAGGTAEGWPFVPDYQEAEGLFVALDTMFNEVILWE